MYCSHNGRSRPRSLRHCAMSSGGAVGPSAARTGSPGTRWIMRNAAVTSTHSETISRPTRRVVKRTQRFSLRVRTPRDGRATASVIWCGVFLWWWVIRRGSAEHPDAHRLAVADDLDWVRDVHRDPRDVPRPGAEQRAGQGGVVLLLGVDLHAQFLPRGGG